MRFVPVLVTAAVVAVGCSSSSGSGGSGGSTASAAPTAAGPTAAGPTAASSASATPSALPTIPAGQIPVTHRTVWLCRPGMAKNPCDTANLNATAVQANGSTARQPFTAAADPPIDCFYVYPTVSTAKGVSAPLASEPAVVSTTLAQAARFSSVCRLYVPIYRQLTLDAIVGAAKITPAAVQQASGDVVSAWHDYLQHDNDGRGVVLIGHSQGSAQLEALISGEIDKSAAERARLVSALLLGGNVQVPVGKDVGGQFQHVPACRTDTQTGCVVAYSTFATTPPSNTLFGRAGGGVNRLAGGKQTSAGPMQVLCVNPAALTGGSAVLHPYLPTAQLSGGTGLIGGTPTGQPNYGTGFLTYPDDVKGECRTANGATFLQVTATNAAGDKRPSLLKSPLPAYWGLHLEDVNIALGDLVTLAGKEAAAFHP